MKKLFVMLLAASMSLGSMAQDFEYEYQGQKLTYTVVDATAKTVKTKDGVTQNGTNVAGNLVSGAVMLPETVVYNGENYTLTAVGKLGFCNTGITSISFPNSVTEIGVSAFAKCSGLSGQLILPKNLVTLGGSAFHQCTGLTGEVIIPNTVTSTLEAFYQCSGLTSVVIGTGITTIGNNAFSGCKSLASVTIPNSVTQISSYAFQECKSLTTITIPASVTYIGSYAFGGSIFSPSGLQHVICEGTTPPTCSSDAFYKPSSIELTVPAGCAEAYAGWGGITTVVEQAPAVQPGDEIEYEGFIYTILNESTCSLTNGKSATGDVVIPESVVIGNTKYTVVAVGESAFSNCTAMTGIKFPETITEIGGSAFYFCTGLTCDLVIPDSVTKLGDMAFGYCNNLKSIKIGNGVTKIGGHTFVDCYNATSLILPESLESIGYQAFQNNAFTSVTLPASVNYIDGYAFAGTIFHPSKLTSVTCEATVPPVCQNNAFGTSAKSIQLTVPAGTERDYKKANVWKDMILAVPAFEETLYLSKGNSIDLADYLVDSIDSYTVENSNDEVAAVTGYYIDAKDFGNTTIVFKSGDEVAATFNIYVCPTVTVVHGEGLLYTHHVLYNSRPELTLLPIPGYLISGVTHDGAKVDNIDENGKYVSTKPITDNSVINLTLEQDANGGPATGVDNVVSDSDIHVYVSDMRVEIVGATPGERVLIYNLQGKLLYDLTNHVINIRENGVYILKVQGVTFKIAVRG
ncbi:MAG: leucine-rich repeat protein [Muribaculaceae bacterium]|nr:leucine-rich repeat protein [Muribaculaceae bacterium]